MTKKNDHLRPGLFSESVFSTIIFPDRPDPDSLEGLQLTINEKSDETLECTRRMREMCAEAKDAGMKTLIALDDQEVNISIQPRSDMIKPKSSRIKLFSQMCGMGIRRKENQSQL